MKPMICMLGASVAVLGLSSAWTQSGDRVQRAERGVVVAPGKLQPGNFWPRTMECVVGGMPAKFPNDNRVTNVGSTAIPAGTTINWTVNPGTKGNYKLSSALNPNRSAWLSNVVGGGLEAGTPCSAVPVLRSSG